MSARMFAAPLILFAIGTAAYAADPGDTAAGKAYFTQTCKQCHSAEPGDGGGEIGPNLVGLFGRPAGVGDDQVRLHQSPDGFETHMESGDTGSLSCRSRRRRYPARSMALPVPVKKDRDNLIAYFQSLTGAAK